MATWGITLALTILSYCTGHNMNTKDIQSRLERFILERKNRDHLVGKTGRITGTNSYQMIPDGWPGYIYVRVQSEGAETNYKAKNNQVKNAPNIPVVIAPNERGIYEVVRVADEFSDFTGGAALPYTDYVPSNEAPITTRRFLPGLVYPTDPVSLSVRVAPYVYGYDGSIVYFAGGTIDLTSNVPATSNKRRLVLVGIDPTANTLSTVNGDDYSVAVTLGASHLAGIDPGGLIPLAGVNLHNGISTVNKESQFVEGRLLFQAAYANKGTGEIMLSAAGGWPSTTNGCAANAKNEYGTNDVDLYSLDFDADTDEYAQWSVWMPDDWDAGTITAKFAWSAASSSGDVVWGLQGRAYANDDAIDQAWGTAQTVTDTLTATGDMCITSETSAITIAGTPAAGEFVQLRVYRDADDAGDTLAADARLLGVKVYYRRG